MSKIFKFYFLNFFEIFAWTSFETLLADFFMFWEKYLILSWPEKGNFCGGKFEISNPSVEHFDMNIQNPSVVQCTILISNL